jgi:hypothetical protein
VWRRGLLPVVLVLPTVAWAGYHLVRLGPVPASSAQRERFLLARVPGYEAIAFLDRRHGSDYTVYAVHAEHLHGYAEGRFLGDWSGPQSFSRVLDARDAAELHRRLAALEVDYLLVPAGPPGEAAAALVHGSPLFVDVFHGRTATMYAVGGPRVSGTAATPETEAAGAAEPRR